MMVPNATKKIASIKFGLLSPTEIRKMSATKVITADTYDDDGFPIPMGLMDTKMGVIEPGLRCQTCFQNVGDCPGHFGHIDAAMPVIHTGYTRIIRDILRCTCRECKRLMVTAEEKAAFVSDYDDWVRHGNDPIRFVRQVLKTARRPNGNCPHCGAEQKKVEFEKPTTYREEGHKLTPVDVREWLEKVPSDEARLMGVEPGVARPEWMVLTVIPVPPITMRPSITLDTGERSEDDLTHKLVDVLRINQRLQENRDAGAPQLIVEDLWELLQYHTTTYIDNQTSGIPPARHRSGRPLKTLSQRLKGKEGRFRSNLSGKRVNFSARTVVSPDPYISINEVGVPRKAATELTVPLRVTPYNIELAREYVARGPKAHPGANYVIRPDGRRLKVTETNKENLSLRIDAGFIIERHLSDGDIVLFNRQPSLHRMSMMAHEVRVMDGKTFRVNLCVCPPYNADFDGDEMNLHVLQGEEARAEARVLMRVQEHILSPRLGGPIIGAIHDHISGAFFLTNTTRLYSKGEVMDILANADLSDVELPEPHEKKDGKAFFTGKQIFSLILPDDLNIRFRSEIASHVLTPDEEERMEAGEIEDPRDGEVLIKDGELLKGTIDEKAIGAFKGELVHRVAKLHGMTAAREFIDNVTRLGLGAIMAKGFSTGIDDEDIPEDARAEIQQTLKEAREEVTLRVDEFNRGELEQMPGRSLEETLELIIMGILGNARDEAGRIVARYAGLTNPAVIMARIGARGSMLNLSQMAGAVGQQAVRGERIHRGYAGRTLSHFKQGDLGADAKGFVTSSYKSGLSPVEFFFHSMGGREGLVDTAVRTARSGYMQRRLINALEDLRVEYDGTVRNTAGTVIQFTYGEDGVDPTRSYRGKAVNIQSILAEELGRDEVIEVDAEKGTYDREDSELMRSVQDELGEDDEFDWE